MNNKWILVESSNINKVSFDLKTQELLINFKPDNTYVYKNVPYYIWEGLVGNESKGKFFHSFIKGKFDYTKLVVENKQQEHINGN